MSGSQSVPNAGSIASVGVTVITSAAPAILDDVDPGSVLNSSSVFAADSASVLAALNATNLGYTGAGVTVGVLSDSFDNLGGAAADEQDGALPPASQIDVLEDDPSGDGTDEGRAMMQVVHDVAPGANLDFYTADVSEQDFANGILALANAGCKIICDDVSYLDEPFFQTGIIANAIQTVEQEGVIFVTAAGNEGEEAYQSSWNAISRTTYDGTTLIDAQNFGNNSPVQTITIGEQAGDTTWELQWNQPFGAATTYLGVLVFQNGTLIGKFSNANIDGFTESDFSPGADDPLIALDLDPGTYQFAIENLSGSDPGVIKDVLFANGTEPYVSLGDANAGTVLGHHASPDAITVGAVNSADTPGNGGTLQSEYFSSSGLGTELWFNYNGTPVSFAPTLLSPVAVSGVDNIQTTLPGGLSDFFGTSAAAPSVAGVIADMLQANPDLTQAQIEEILELSATAFGNSSVAGAGLVNAALAVQGDTTLIVALFQQVLGRNPSTGDSTYWQNQLDAGLDPATMRSLLAESSDSQENIDALFERVLNRTASSTDINFWEQELATQTTFANMESIVATSVEATADINYLFEQILDRSANSEDISFWQNLLVSDLSFSDMRTLIADSAEAAADISYVFQQVLGRSATSVDIGFWQSQIANGLSLGQARVSIAESAEATSDIDNLFQQVLNRSASSTDVSYWQSQLADNVSLAGMRILVAESAEATTDIGNLFQQVLGRAATTTDIGFWQSQLANNVSQTAMQALLAQSSEAQGDLTSAYQAAYSSLPSQNVLTWLTNELATTSTSLQQITTALQDPLIIDTVANQGITDQSTDQPFAVAIVSDPQSGTETATITLLSNGSATDANGTLSGTGLTHTGTGTYTLSSSTAAGLTTELDSLVFTPTQGEVSVGQSVTTNLKVSVTDSKGNTGTDTTTSITATAVSTPTNLNFLYGSIGSDTFTLPSGADVVAENVNPLGNDVVNGFNLAQDIVQLSAAQFGSFAAVQAALSSSGGNAVLALDNSGDRLTLVGVNPTKLTASNFMLV